MEASGEPDSVGDVVRGMKEGMGGVVAYTTHGVARPRADRINTKSEEHLGGGRVKDDQSGSTVSEVRPKIRPVRDESLLSEC